MNHIAPVRLTLRLRPASAAGATVQVAVNGTALPSCTLAPNAWTDCTLSLSDSSVREGINQLTLTADTISPSADRPGDARELSFVMQASRLRVGR
jgi:hypothetical protein